MTFGGHTPQVEEGAWIAPTATLIGQVSIGAGAVVMFGAVLRADRDAISLGAGSNFKTTWSSMAIPRFQPTSAPG